MQNGTATSEDSLVLSYKTNIFLPHDSAILPLGIYPNDLKTYIHTETCTQMFTAALFLIAKTWKQPGCVSVGGWINKLSDNGLLFSTKKK